jgi:hypothetical protein
MRLLHPVRIAMIGLTGAMLLIVTVGSPAAGHTHPTPVELDSPAVVRVETYARVSISLIEHNRVGKHIGLLQRTYQPLLASGSGFAVDGAGSIVTSGKLVDVDLRRAEIYAANKIFNERYGAAAPLPADPFGEQTIKDTDPTDRTAGRLRRCYRPNSTDDTGGCVAFTTLVVKVLPFVSDQKRYGNLDATVAYPPSGTAGDVVVLKVGASSMPTVNLARSTEGVAAFSTLGFVEPPLNVSALKSVEGHFIGAGATQVKRDEFFEPLRADMAAGMLGGPVVGERGQVVGFLTERSGAGKGAPPSLGLIGPEAIRKALAAVGVTPHRGPTDIAYETALHNYKNKRYTPAVPNLTQTLNLYPGHALATAALADANRKKGTAEEAVDQGLPVQNRGSTVWWGSWYVWAAAAAVALLLAALAVLLVRRRRDRTTAGPVEVRDDQDEPPPPVQARPRPQPAAPRARPDGADPPPVGRAAVDRDATRLISVRDVRTDLIAEPDVCSVCGQQALPSQHYCTHCGQRLR